MSKPVDIPVRMDDGVVISTEVVYPTDPATGARAAGTFPVLLTQNPYGTARSDPTAPGDYFVQRGYIYVASAVRGTGASGGQVSWFGQRQGQDGAELVNWAAHSLSGSDGRVGLDGCSYLGVDQWFTAAAVGPEFRAEGDHPLLHGLQLLRRPDRRRRHPHSVRRRDRAGRAARTPGQPRHRPAVGHHRAGGRRRTAILRQRLLAVAGHPAAHAADRGQRNPRPERGRLE